MYNNHYGNRKEKISFCCLFISKTERGNDLNSELELGPYDSRGHLCKSDNQVLGVDKTAVCCLVLPQLKGYVSTPACVISSFYGNHKKSRNKSKGMFFRATSETSAVECSLSLFIRVEKLLTPKFDQLVLR